MICKTKEDELAFSFRTFWVHTTHCPLLRVEAVTWVPRWGRSLCLSPGHEAEPPTGASGRPQWRNLAEGQLGADTRPAPALQAGVSTARNCWQDRKGIATHALGTLTGDQATWERGQVHFQTHSNSRNKSKNNYFMYFDDTLPSADIKENINK